MLLRIYPSLMHYDWGDPFFIPELTGCTQDGSPCAEAWFGAHKNAPSRIGIIEASELSSSEGYKPDSENCGSDTEAYAGLDSLVASMPKTILGERVYDRFGAFPYLLKILAADKPLSIQVHPGREQAIEGFNREEKLKIPADSQRSYRDPGEKTEMLLALTDFYAFCGLKSFDMIAKSLDFIPEIRDLLPPYIADASGTEKLLKSYASLSPALLGPALEGIAERMIAGGEESFGIMKPVRHDLLLPLFESGKEPDRGIFYLFIMNPLHLDPGSALFLPAGIIHSYIRGAGLEIMSSSDNVLRAGLTSKHVNVNEMIRALDVDLKPFIIRAKAHEDNPHEMVYSAPAEEFQISRMEMKPGKKIFMHAEGPETLLFMPGTSFAGLKIESEGSFLELRRGEACLVSHGCFYSLESSHEAPVYRVRVPPQSSADKVSCLKKQEKKDGDFSEAIKRNIAVTGKLFESGKPASLIGIVSGTKAACDFWQRRLDDTGKIFRANHALSFHEDLPVNQALGMLLLWQRLKDFFRPGEGALTAFVFGDGKRAAPFTEAECNQKPAIRSFVSTGKGSKEKKYLSIVELALRYFAPVENYLRRSGFDGMVIKWGDEVQIPTLPLDGLNPLFRNADVVRFVSMRKVIPDDALNKDWVGVDNEGKVRAFIPRRPIEEMEKLADRGLMIRKNGELHGGVNLGSIAVSRILLDILLEEFSADINNPDALRSERPDLDPSFFTALTIAVMEDRRERDNAWEIASVENESIRRMKGFMPDIFGRLCRAVERFRKRHGRNISIVAMDFEDQYWGDIGQHRQIRDFYMSLCDRGPTGEIAAELAGISRNEEINEIPCEAAPKTEGNYQSSEEISQDTSSADNNTGEKLHAESVGEPVIKNSILVNSSIESGEVIDSVLIDAGIISGRIRGSVLVGTKCKNIRSTDAFDVDSAAPSMVLERGSGTYRVLSHEGVHVKESERMAGVCMKDKYILMRVHEDMDLKESCNYENPVCGNEISFRKLHDEVAGMDPEDIIRQRQKRKQDVERSISVRGG